MLNEILTTDIYRFFILFTRIGAAMMVMPGFGGQRVPARIQLVFSLALAFLLLPSLGALVPPLPRSVGALVLIILGEATVGAFLGLLVQAVMAALHIAATIIGFNTGLTNAFSFDAVAEQQSSLLTSFFSTLALVIIFATDLHHLMLRAVADSYATFPIGQALPLGDFADTLARTLSASFALALKLSAPLIAFGLIFYSGLGLLSRMVPQMQVFFVGLPVQMLTGLWMLMVSLPLIVLLFLQWFQDSLVPFLVPR